MKHSTHQWRELSFRRLAGPACAAVLLLALTPTLTWAVVRAEAVTMKYQVQNSDVIVRGKCLESSTGWANRHIFTTHKIEVKKYLKTPDKKFAEKNSVLTVAQLGGRVEKPIPLQETHPLKAAIYPGEEVVLFLQAPRNVPDLVRAKYDRNLQAGRIEPSPLMEHYRLTTMNVSKFTVVKDPATGTELVTRVSVGGSHLPASATLTKQAVEAFEAGENSIAVSQDGKIVRYPVQVGKLRLEPDQLQTAPTEAALSIEQEVQGMRSLIAPWNEFERAVQALLAGEDKAGAPQLLSGGRETRGYRTMQPRTDQ